MEKLSFNPITKEQKEKLELVKKKIGIVQDPIGKISKPTLAFGESPYNITYPKSTKEAEEEAPCEFSRILSGSTYQSLGYESLEAADNKYFI